jgi:uncharacterized protein (TIGR00304 family)
MVLEINLTSLGGIIVVIGFALIFIGIFLLIRGGSRGRVKSGGIILIGPIPIVWGSDRGMLKWVVLAMALFFIFYIFLVYIGLMR